MDEMLSLLNNNVKHDEHITTDNVKMPLQDRILEIIKERKLNQSKVAQSIGVSRASVSQWVHGLTTPDGGNLFKLAELCGVSYKWLLEGKGKKYPTSGTVNINGDEGIGPTTAAHLMHGTYLVKEQDGAVGNASRFTSLPIRNVPVINKKNILERINPTELTPENHKDWCPTRSVSAKAFALSAQELPTPNDRFGFHSSSFIIIDPDYEIETGKLVLVLDANNNLSIKRYEAIGKLNYLGSFNENYQPILLDETYQIIGRVAGSYQEF